MNMLPVELQRSIISWVISACLSDVLTFSVSRYKDTETISSLLLTSKLVRTETLDILRLLLDHLPSGETFGYVFSDRHILNHPVFVQTRAVIIPEPSHLSN